MGRHREGVTKSIFYIFACHVIFWITISHYYAMWRPFILLDTLLLEYFFQKLGGREIPLLTYLATPLPKSLGNFQKSPEIFKKSSNIYKNSLKSLGNHRNLRKSLEIIEIIVNFKKSSETMGFFWKSLWNHQKS